MVIGVVGAAEWVIGIGVVCYVQLSKPEGGLVC